MKKGRRILKIIINVNMTITIQYNTSLIIPGLIIFNVNNKPDTHAPHIYFPMEKECSMNRTEILTGYKMGGN